MKTTVFIPCIPKHFLYLGRVISAFIKGTVVPDEIIICISDTEQIININEYLSFFLSKYNYLDIPKIRIYNEPKLLYTGEACNILKNIETGDLIIIQAADDVPHPRRVEIVQNYFEMYDIVSLNHSYFGLNHIKNYSPEQLIQMAEERIKNPKVIMPDEIYKNAIEKPNDVYGQFTGFAVAAGTVCYLRQVVDEVTWNNMPKGQDKFFCREVILKYKRSIIIDAPLYYYYK